MRYGIHRKLTGVGQRPAAVLHFFSATNVNLNASFCTAKFRIQLSESSLDLQQGMPTVAFWVVPREDVEHS